MRRSLEVDALKALGIVAVVLIHSVRAPFHPQVSSVEVWLGQMTRFAVPGFLLCSGFLYATLERVPPATTWRRLRRILVPYLIFSLLAQLWHQQVGLRTTTGSALTDLLLAASFGPYYYVFVILLLALATPLFARMGRGTALFFALLLPAQAWVEVAPDAIDVHPFWKLRNPLQWWSYFLLGWLLRLHYPALAAWIAARRGLLCAILGTAVAASALAFATVPPSAIERTIAWLNIYAVLLLVFAATCGRPRVPAALRTLSDATYPIYLLHLFFVYSVAMELPAPRGRADWLAIGAPWAAGLLGSLALVGVAKRLLGHRSRDWIGA